MNTLKYIAAGFTEDAEKLFNDFAKCEDYDFKIFCNVWKKHKFNNIFMGRSSFKELREFIGEIYQLTLNYMTSSSLGSQIAAIYLLYALYRTQNVISPVKIRISKLQYLVLENVHLYAIKEKVHTLHYVIDFLKKNCLELVANGNLYGPCCSLYKDNPSKSKADQFAVLSDLKQNMAIFQESNVIFSLKKMRSKYLEQKNDLMFSSSVLKDNDFEVIDDYNQKIEKLKEVLGNSKSCSGHSAKNNSGQTVERYNLSVEPIKERNDIGYRRNKLKTAASEMMVMTSKARCQEEETLQKDDNDVNDDTVEISLVKKRPYNKRLPVNERRVGRPKKYVEKPVTSDESEDSDFKYSFQIQHKQGTKTKRGPTGRRKASYLRNYEGPLILNSNQKPVDSYSDTSEEAFVDELEF